MKSNMNEAQKKILLYNLDPSSEEGKLFCDLAEERDCEIVLLRDQDLQDNIKQLYTIGPGAQESAEAVSVSQAVREGAYCVFCAFTREAFSDLLDAWKEAGVGRGVLKSVATANNQTWPLIDLFAELRREHVITQAYVALRRHVLGVEHKLKEAGIELPAAYEGEDPAQHARIRTMHEAKQLLRDIQAIDTVEQIHHAHEAFLEAWQLS